MDQTCWGTSHGCSTDWELVNLEARSSPWANPEQFMQWGRAPCSGWGGTAITVCGWCVSGGIHMNARTQGFPAECCNVTRRSALFTSPVLADRWSLIIAVYIPLNTLFLLLASHFQAASGSRWVGSSGREWGFILAAAICQIKNISLSVSLFKAFAKWAQTQEISGLHSKELRLCLFFIQWEGKAGRGRRTTVKSIEQSL